MSDNNYETNNDTRLDIEGVDSNTAPEESTNVFTPATDLDMGEEAGTIEYTLPQTEGAEPASAPEPEDDNGKEEEQGKDKDEKTEEKKGKKGKKIAKMGLAYPLQVALYALFKLVTWLFNIFLTVVLVGLISATVVCVAFVIYIKTYVDPNYTGLDNLQFESSLYTTISYVDSNTGNEVEMDRLVGSI